MPEVLLNNLKDSDQDVPTLCRIGRLTREARYRINLLPLFRS